MKKILLALLSTTILLFMAGCGDTTKMPDATADIPANSAQPQKSDNNGARALIAYFTVPEADGTDTSAGASRVSETRSILHSLSKMQQAGTCSRLRRFKIIPIHISHFWILLTMNCVMMRGPNWRAT